MTDLKAKLDAVNKSEHSQSSGGWFKPKEGSNAIRVLSVPEELFEDYHNGICYTGCGFKGSPKFLAYVLDRADGEVKLYKLPYGMFESITVFKDDEDTKFDDFPMPYDLKIHAIGAGTKEVKYTLTPSPKVVEVPAEILEALSKKKSALEVIKAMQEKNKAEHANDPAPTDAVGEEEAPNEDPGF